MLTVYRASAGAGKTHKLTGEYLLLLFSQPLAYKRILAVTFTNKATDEMKTRIVEELYCLASGKKSDYIPSLTSQYELSEKQIRQQAKDILTVILHDYASFYISTIDRFFQQTMRAFTREIGLQGGYGIEMDQELVLSEAIDNMLSDLEKPESKELLGWLLRFAEDKIESGGEWNLRREIMTLSREIFKENYKVYSNDVDKDIQDKRALENYKNELLSIIRAIESEAKLLGEKGLNILAQYALQPSDFKGGSRSPLLFFEKLAKGEMKEPTATFIGLADNVDACYTKTTPQATIQIISCVFEDGLNDCIKSIITLFSDLTAYNTAKEIVRYYYTLGILNDVSHQIAAYREEKNIMLIADTTELLNKVIDGSDAPFIYEKTGTRIDHYMIDEFQDTSGMQWSNFRPLVGESLAHKQSNLIVGDVKQSIYRFRNSDWKLLDEQVQHDFLAGSVNEETLKENWRSSKEIVSFNNSFFTATPEILQSIYNDILESSSLNEEERSLFFTKIMSAYDKSYQLTPSPLQDKRGHVKIDFIDNEAGDWKEQAMLRLPAILEQLQDNGYALKDIAILVRTNQEGANVAETLLSYKENNPSATYRYDIISDEALFVSSSNAVRYIISILRHIKNPEDKTNKQMALLSYHILTGNVSETNSITDFPEEITQQLHTLSRQSLYEIVEGLYRLFFDRFRENEQVFIQAFLDMIAEFSQKESPDISRFLKWWDETGYKRTIATPDEQNAVRILTIHKSKGLGFKVVLIPFGDWEIDHRPTKSVILWCHPQKSPFNKLHLVPVRYGQILAKTIFAKEYFDEKLHAYIDNLNTLYVAFTRAKEELIVFAPRPKKVDEESGSIEKITSISDLLWCGLCSNHTATRANETLETLSSSFDFKNGSFELGDWFVNSKETKKGKTIEEIPMSRLSSISPDDRLQLRLHGKGFFFDNAQRKYGALMHDILSRIKTQEDIVSAVDSHLISGIIDKKEATLLITNLSKLIDNPDISPWFDKSSHILNEIDILFGAGNTKRPDRVIITNKEVTVVDYKFGEQEDKKHIHQVKNYIKLIKEMGYLKVNGFLWYIELNKIVPVI